MITATTCSVEAKNVVEVAAIVGIAVAVVVIVAGAAAVLAQLEIKVPCNYLIQPNPTQPNRIPTQTNPTQPNSTQTSPKPNPALLHTLACANQVDGASGIVPVPPSRDQPGKGQQPAVSIVDDRLYVFEAVGLLLGLEEIPADQQQLLLSSLLQPLLQQVKYRAPKAATIHNAIPWIPYLKADE